MRILAALASGTLLLLLSACAGEATPSTPPEKSTPAETTAAPTETKAEPGGDDDAFHHSGSGLLNLDQGQGQEAGDHGADSLCASHCVRVRRRVNTAGLL